MNKNEIYQISRTSSIRKYVTVTKCAGSKERALIQSPQVKTVSNFPLGNITLESLLNMAIQKNRD
jgi:hypothetical protein